MGQRLRVTGAPAILFDNGARLPGLMNAVDLERELQADPKKTAGR